MCLKDTQSLMEATMETMDFFRVSSVIGKAGECHQGREKGKESRRKELKRFKDRGKQLDSQRLYQECTSLWDQHLFLDKIPSH
jgi:hypothetical protein